MCGEFLADDLAYMRCDCLQDLHEGVHCGPRESRLGLDDGAPGRSNGLALEDLASVDRHPESA